jgi:hypothetical protein
MEAKLLERIEPILREDGFTRITRQSSAHSATISAQKGRERLVIHITDRDELPYYAIANDEVPPASDIRLTATLPGLSPNPAGQVIQRAGQGGALRRMERLKRH